tara:strand:- start:543 stop:719 length:177 start_codon:yes stop_codon:yes gene_type:complete
MGALKDFDLRAVESKSSEPAEWYSLSHEKTIWDNAKRTITRLMNILKKYIRYYKIWLE